MLFVKKNKTAKLWDAEQTEGKLISLHLTRKAQKQATVKGRATGKHTQSTGKL